MFSTQPWEKKHLNFPEPESFCCADFFVRKRHVSQIPPLGSNRGGGPGAYTTRSLVQDEKDGSTWKHQRWE